jgi:hypothetical protein
MPSIDQQLQLLIRSNPDQKHDGGKQAVNENMDAHGQTNLGNDPTQQFAL